MTPSGQVSEEIWQLNSGLPVLLRGLRSTDLALHWELFFNCSQQSIYQRFFQNPEPSKVTDREVARFTDFDRTREVAIAALLMPQGPEMGVVRLVDLGQGCAEFAVLIADPWQRQGLGRKLMQKVIAVAHARGVTCLQGYVLCGNQPMLHLCRRLGFAIERLSGEGLYQVHLDLVDLPFSARQA